jgi:hypothetical protein
LLLDRLIQVFKLSVAVRLIGALQQRPVAPDAPGDRPPRCMSGPQHELELLADPLAAMRVGSLPLAHLLQDRVLPGQTSITETELIARLTIANILLSRAGLPKRELEFARRCMRRSPDRDCRRVVQTFVSSAGTSGSAGGSSVMSASRAHRAPTV